MKNQFNTNYFYKILVPYGNIKSYFIVCCVFLLQFLIASVSVAEPAKFCRQYFVHIDLLESLRPEEKASFLTLAQKYSETMEHPHDSVRDIKVLLNHELKKFIESKRLSTRLSQPQPNLASKSLSQDLLILFFVLVRELQERGGIERELRTSTLSEAKYFFSQQKLQQLKFIKFEKLLRKYEAESFEDLLAKILMHYETEDIYEAFLQSAGKPERLYFVSRSFKVDILEVEYLLNQLLSLQVNVNQRDSDWRNVLYYASAVGGGDVIRLLVDAGVEIDNTDKTGRSALFHAIQEQNREAVHALLLAGANRDLQDSMGETPLMQALNPARKEECVIAEILVAAGVKLDLLDRKGNTALMYAIETQSLANVMLLLNAGGNKLLTLFNQDGDSPLFLAAKRASPEIVDVILSSGADINLQNKEGTTALMRAASSSREKNVRALLSANADSALKNKKGKTALSLAKKAVYENDNRLKYVWQINNLETILLLKNQIPEEPSYGRALKTWFLKNFLGKK